MRIYIRGVEGRWVGGRGVQEGPVDEVAVTGYSSGGQTASVNARYNPSTFDYQVAMGIQAVRTLELLQKMPGLTEPTIEVAPSDGGKITFRFKTLIICYMRPWAGDGLFQVAGMVDEGPPYICTPPAQWNCRTAWVFGIDQAKD